MSVDASGVSHAPWCSGVCVSGPLALEPPDGSTTDGLFAVRRRAIDAVRAEDPVRAEFTKDFLG